MRPVSNQPECTYATAKIHKFNSLDDINVDNLKFRPIISQIGTCTCNAAKVIAKYLNHYVVLSIKYQIYKNLHLLLKINIL